MSTARHISCPPIHKVGWILYALMVGYGQPVGASNEATVNFEATFVLPPCTLTGPSTVALGAITVSGVVNRHPSFDLAITCPLARATALYAEARGHFVSTKNWVRMDSSARRVDDTSGDGLVRLKFLMAGGSTVPMTVMGEGSANGELFCQGDASRTCTLTPWTFAGGDTFLGAMMAVITFTLVTP
ncbi:MAG: hypothetical protein ACRCYK_13800 [Aeromonas hydrophila]